jgi:hypothetical protein
LERDAVSEPLELSDEAPGLAFGVGAAVEVIAAEILVVDVVAEDLVGGDEDRV